MNSVYVIAEAGVNHDGSLERAIKLIDVACEAGADAVKFQTFKADLLVCKGAEKADYQKALTNVDETQHEMLRRLELSNYMHEKLMGYCVEKGIDFLSTPFDVESAKYLHDLGLQTFKIPSGEITNLPYLECIGGFKKQIILSTGMATLTEVEDAVRVLTEAGSELSQLTVLHANTEYPTPYNDVNLLAMRQIKKSLGVSVGYSDHTLGIEVPIAAVALGAVVIEKHFTLDRSLAGPDHKASLEPAELVAMVEGIRRVERSLGDGVKAPSSSERKNLPIARKSIVAKTTIKSGDIFTVNNLTVKRPGTGINPMRWYDVLGKKADRCYEQDDLIYDV